MTNPEKSKENMSYPDTMHPILYGIIRKENLREVDEQVGRKILKDLGYEVNDN